MTLLIGVILSMGQMATGWDEFSSTFAFSKTMTSCLGSDLYRSYQRQLAQAGRYCNQQPVGRIPEPDPWVTFPVIRQQDTFTQVNINDDQSHNTRMHDTAYATGPVHSPYQPSAMYGSHLNYDGGRGYIPPRPVVVHGGVRVADNYRPLTVPYEYYRPYNGKSLNQMPLLDFESLQSMTEMVKAKVSNFTCVLRKLDVIDSNYNVNTAKLIQHTLAYPVSHSLKHDLVKRIDHCSQMMNCQPIDDKESPVPGSLQKILGYLSCEKKLRILACMKEDLRKNIGDYDLSGFPLQASENERINKLLFVLWGAESSEFELQ